MDYKALLKARTELQVRYVEYRDAILADINTLRDLIENLLDAPKDVWQYPDEPSRRTIETFVQVEDDTLKKPNQDNIYDAMDQEDTVMFSIAIGFPEQDGDRPVTFQSTPVAINYSESKPYFALVAPDTMEPDKWIEDINQFAQAVIQFYFSEYAYNPFDDNTKNKKIGFQLKDV